MDEMTVREESQGLGYLVPRERREWVAFGLTVAAISLVLAWMWGSLVVLATNWSYVLGFVVLTGLWVGMKTRRTSKARGRILKALEASDEPVTTSKLFKLMARYKLSPEVVTAQLQVLLEEGEVVADATDGGITYAVPSCGTPALPEH